MDKAVAGCLSDAHTILGIGGIDRNNYPTLSIPPLIERADELKGFKDKLVGEINSKWGSIYKYTDPRDLYSVYVTPAASPHTVAVGKEDEPTHLITWWFGENGERLDMLALSRLTSKQRRPIITKIAEGISASVHYFQHRYHIHRKKIPRLVKPYGLTGHAIREERERGESPTRGAQSNPQGHANTACIAKGATMDAKIKALESENDPVTPKEMLKQIDPVSEAILRRWGVVIRPMIRRYRKTHGKKFIYDLNFDHKVERGKLTGTEVRFSDLLALDFSKGISLADALEITTDLYSEKWFGGLYEKLWNIYEKYWKEDAVSKESIISSSTNELMYFIRGGKSASEKDQELTREELKSLLHDVLLTPPSYGQLVKWIADPAVSDLTRGKLIRKLEQYKHLDQVFNDQVEENEVRDYYKYIVRKMYDLNNEEAEEFLLYWSDLVKDPQGTYDGKPGWQTIEFLYSKYLSTSYMFGYEVDKRGRIWVNKITLSPKLATTKGGAEDLQGARLMRPKGQ